jgi:hypothetical protein
MKPKVTKYIFAKPRSFRSGSIAPVLFKFEGTLRGKDQFHVGYMSRQFSYATIIALSRFSDTPEEAYARYVKNLGDSVKNAEQMLEEARRELAAAPSGPGEAIEEDRDL